MAKHDENKDVRILSRKCRIGAGRIEISKSQVIGLRTWGRIDFLCKCCGYVLVYGSGGAKVYRPMSDDEVKQKKAERKQLRKANNNKQNNNPKAHKR